MCVGVCVPDSQTSPPRLFLLHNNRKRPSRVTQTLKDGEGKQQHPSQHHAGGEIRVEIRCVHVKYPPRLPPPVHTDSSRARVVLTRRSDRFRPDKTAAKHPTGVFLFFTPGDLKRDRLIGFSRLISSMAASVPSPSRCVSARAFREMSSHEHAARERAARVLESFRRITSPCSLDATSPEPTTNTGPACGRKTIGGTEKDAGFRVRQEQR